MVEHHPWLIPTFGFVSGIASFFLVERKQDQFAQILSILMLLGWLWLALEKLLQRGIAQWFGIEVPPALLRFLTQLLHQESLFFVIPFFVITTSWNSGQVIFTSLLIISAFISLVDPLYYRWLAPRRWLYFIFHGITLFAVLLVALPLIFHLPTPKSYLWALAIAVLLSLPGVARDLVLVWWKRIPAMLLMMLAACAIGLLSRPWIPPASIWLTQVAITEHVDDESRLPKNRLRSVSRDQLHNGIYAYTAIHAPRGLQERIYHQWKHDGKLVDKIALDVSGGREEGYRSWSHKVNFPEDAVGNWQIMVVTEAQQVLGVVRFKVVDSIKSQGSTTASSATSIEPQAGSAPQTGSEPQPEVENSASAMPSPDSDSSSESLAH